MRLASFLIFEKNKTETQEVRKFLMTNFMKIHRGIRKKVVRSKGRIKKRRAMFREGEGRSVVINPPPVILHPHTHLFTSEVRQAV